jgi:regulator of sigma E protease
VSWTALRWEIVRAAIDKRELDLDVRGASGASYRAVIPAQKMAGLDVDGDVLDALGMQMWRPRPTIEQVLPDGAAARAGLKPGDQVTAIDGKPVVDGIDFIDAVRKAAGRTLQVQVTRAGQVLTLPVTPERDPTNGQGLVKLMVAQTPDMVTVKAGPAGALAQGVQRTWETSVLTVKMIGRMVVGQASLKNVSGPITIARVARETARSGLEPFLEFIAFISVMLGVMNLLPIPVLDGGHLLYYSLEVLTGRPVPERVGELAQRAGIGILMTLMMVAVFNDIVRLIS